MADAQLSNVTRQKFKEAYDLHTAAIIERAEKQILLAKHARTLINLLDDTPMVPGEDRPAFPKAEEARDLLNDAEDSLRRWSPSVEPIHTSASKLGPNAMATTNLPDRTAGSEPGLTVDQQRVEAMERAQEQEIDPPYPTAEKTEHVALAS